jgi:hypothetical protein
MPGIVSDKHQLNGAVNVSTWADRCLSQNVAREQLWTYARDQSCRVNAEHKNARSNSNPVPTQSDVKSKPSRLIECASSVTAPSNLSTTPGSRPTHGITATVQTLTNATRLTRKALPLTTSCIIEASANNIETFVRTLEKIHILLNAGLTRRWN